MKTRARHLTTAQAAAIVGVSPQRFLQLAQGAKIVHSAEVGRSLLWTRTAARAVARTRKPLGRPRKEVADGAD